MKTENLSVNWMFPTHYGEETKEQLENALMASAQALADALADQSRQELEKSKPGTTHASMTTVPTDVTQDGEQMHLMCFLCLTRGTHADVLSSVLIKNVVAPIGQIAKIKNMFTRDFEELAQKSGADVTIVERTPPEG
jgi:hypothetical protein